MKKIYSQFLIIILLFPLPALAWNSNVHRVIAEIAWQNMTPPARAQFGCLLRQFSRSWPKVRTFQQMATWPDGIKAQGVTAFNQWHFISQPFSPDNRTPLPLINDENAVWAVNQGVAVLTDDSRDPAMQAWFLAFVVHIVGDLHQPLHTITRVTKAHPKGDLGGNLFIIDDPNAKNLHQFWDQALGAVPATLYRKADVTAFANKLEKRYPQQSFGKQIHVLDPAIWAKQSFDIAKNFVYQLPENSRPSHAYMTKGQEIALRQIALAGYRLANLLNHIAQAKKWHNCQKRSD